MASVTRALSTVICRFAQPKFIPTNLCKSPASITNNGGRPGTEIVQLYLRDVVGSVTPPVIQLKGISAALAGTRRDEKGDICGAAGATPEVAESGNETRR